MPVASSGRRSGLPARSGAVGSFGLGDREARRHRRPRDELLQRGRAVAARQAQPHAVAALGRRLPRQVQQRRPHAARVAARAAFEVVGAGRDAFPAQAGVRAPARRDGPLVLRVGGQPRGRGGQVAGQAGEDRAAVLGRGVALAAARRLGLDAADEVVVGGEQRRVLQRAAGRAVARRAARGERAQQAAAGVELAPRRLARKAGVADPEARLQPAVAEAAHPLAVETRHRVAAAFPPSSNGRSAARCCPRSVRAGCCRANCRSSG